MVHGRSKVSLDNALLKEWHPRVIRHIKIACQRRRPTQCEVYSMARRSTQGSGKRSLDLYENLLSTRSELATLCVVGAERL